MLNYLKKSRGVLGMNSRNLDYIRPANRRRARLIADNKLLTKRILKKNGIKVPSLLCSIKSHRDLESFDWNNLPNSFVLKPNRGLGGEGIVVIYGKKRNGNWVKADRQEVTIQDLKTHISNILEGNYSLAGTLDVAFFEERVKILKSFKSYSYRGIPDIRVIVFNNVPVMAMLRLPTEQSRGRSNLHLGGICAGIDLATGVTTTSITRNLATQHEYLIDFVPNTRLSLSGVAVPHWQEILETAVRAQQVTGIGYLGIDIMIDRERGPLVAELNARPGLGIQIANLSPLGLRLQKVEGLKIKSVRRGVRVGQDLFGGEIEEDVEDITGKKVLGIFEMATIENPELGASALTEVKIDTGAYSSSIDLGLAQKIGYGAIVDLFNKEEYKNLELEEADNIVRRLRSKYLDGSLPLLADFVRVDSASGRSVRPKIKARISLGESTFEALPTLAERKDLRCAAIIGRRDLKRFIIDPGKISLARRFNG